MSKDCQSTETNCVRDGRRGLRRDQKLPHGEQRVECAGVSFALLKCHARMSNSDAGWLTSSFVSCVIMSDVTSNMDVTNAFTMKFRSNVILPMKSRMDESQHQIERRACEESCTERTRDKTSESSSVTVTSYADLTTYFQRTDPDKRASASVVQ